MKQVTRLEDMSQKGRLFVFQEDDGDLIIGVCEEENGLIQPASKVQFCTSFSGGGQSPNTFRALKELMKAIEKDNIEHPSRAVIEE